LDLTFVLTTRGNTGTNVKSTALRSGLNQFWHASDSA
jgi:hypothetical protein